MAIKVGGTRAGAGGWLIAGALAALAGLAGFAGCGGFGVETYQERPPAASLALRMVAREGREAELLPRWSEPGEALAVERAAVVAARHIRRVRLLDAADGTRVIVLELDDLGRTRLAEATLDGVGERLAIVVDGRIVAAPTIRTPLTEGETHVAVPPADIDRAFTALTGGTGSGDASR
jgi:preprotein translocase subunit SecD